MIISNLKSKRKANCQIKKEIWAKWFKIQTLRRQSWQSKLPRPSKYMIKASWTSTHKNMYFKNCKSTAVRRFSSQENMNTVIKHQITILIKMTINSSVREFTKSRMFLTTIMIYIKIPLKLKEKFLIIFKINLLNKRWMYKISNNLLMTQMKKMILVNLTQNFPSN